MLKSKNKKIKYLENLAKTYSIHLNEIDENDSLLHDKSKKEEFHSFLKSLVCQGRLGSRLSNKLNTYLTEIFLESPKQHARHSSLLGYDRFKTSAKQDILKKNLNFEKSIEDIIGNLSPTSTIIEACNYISDSYRQCTDEKLVLNLEKVISHLNSTKKEPRGVLRDIQTNTLPDSKETELITNLEEMKDKHQKYQEFTTRKIGLLQNHIDAITNMYNQVIKSKKTREDGE